ncbi:MAG: PEP-CTERM sorting domain-containing protein [Chlorobaculum sp.]|nr:PEP-CTERM sorting domain-containing protein [Chlorobaculum sp.]
MKKDFFKVILVALGVMLFNQAQATVLSYNISMDNGFEVYLSTDNSTAGTLIGSGNWWPTSYNGSSLALTPGQTYYLHVYGYDQGGMAGFLGQFTLSGTDHAFANGANNLLTNTSDWQASSTGWNTYSTPTSWGTNGVMPWGLLNDIDGTATWIWSGDTNAIDNAYFTTTIQAVPEPSSTMLMGLGGLGIMAMTYANRRKADSAA